MFPVVSDLVIAPLGLCPDAPPTVATLYAAGAGNTTGRTWIMPVRIVPW